MQFRSQIIWFKLRSLYRNNMEAKIYQIRAGYLQLYKEIKLVQIFEKQEYCSNFFSP
jgi:hypothetical protein